jgi:hypothetical protein
MRSHSFGRVRERKSDHEQLPAVFLEARRVRAGPAFVHSCKCREFILLCHQTLFQIKTAARFTKITKFHSTFAFAQYDARCIITQTV